MGGRGAHPSSTAVTARGGCRREILIIDLEERRIRVFAADGAFLMRLTGAWTDYGPFTGADSVVV